MIALALLAAVALAQDDAPVGEMSYEGSSSGSAANYMKGKPVSVAHSGGNVAVRCMETEKLSGRVQYTVYGTAEAPMETFGKGVGLSVSGDANGGSVRTRVPSSKGAGVSTTQVDLTVNVPKGVSALTVTQSGKGWVQVLDCSGNVKVTAGTGGAFVSGTLTGASVSATGGDVKVDVDASSPLKNATSISSAQGNATLILPSAQGGRLTVKGEEVSVQQTVMGTNTPTFVQGDMGLGGPAISVAAKKRAEVSQH